MCHRGRLTPIRPSSSRGGASKSCHREEASQDNFHREAPPILSSRGGLLYFVIARRPEADVAISGCCGVRSGDCFAALAMTKRRCPAMTAHLSSRGGRRPTRRSQVAAVFCLEIASPSGLAMTEKMPHDAGLCVIEAGRLRKDPPHRAEASPSPVIARRRLQILSSRGGFPGQFSSRGSTNFVIARRPQADVAISVCFGTRPGDCFAALAMTERKSLAMTAHLSSREGVSRSRHREEASQDNFHREAPPILSSRGGVSRSCHREEAAGRRGDLRLLRCAILRLLQRFAPRNDNENVPSIHRQQSALIMTPDTTRRAITW
jgi:hypothetical protein